MLRNNVCQTRVNNILRYIFKIWQFSLFTKVLQNLYNCTVVVLVISNTVHGSHSTKHWQVTINYVNWGTVFKKCLAKNWFFYAKRVLLKFSINLFFNISHICSPIFANSQWKVCSNMKFSIYWRRLIKNIHFA